MRSMTGPSEEGLTAELDAAGALAAALGAALGEVVIGRPEAIRLALIALLSGGHLLIEDTPGVGKTLLAKALARAIGGTMGRVQGTPDLLPSELTGVSIYDAAGGEWRFHPGPLFAHVVMFDELNRTTPRTQSALLEAMQEHQVSVDGVSHALPRPFFVVATQNPAEQTGTFPLVESQRDRFAVAAAIGYPPREAERTILLGPGGQDALDRLTPLTSPGDLTEAQKAVRHIHVAPAVADYVIDLATETRRDPAVEIGASPRANLDVVRTAQAHALLSGRDFVSPQDVQAMAGAALGHRLVLRGQGDWGAATALVADIVGRVPVPRG